MQHFCRPHWRSAINWGHWRQEAQTKQKIINAEKKAIFEIRNLTVDLAISASETILSNELDVKKSENLIKQSIKNININ